MTGAPVAGSTPHLSGAASWGVIALMTGIVVLQPTGCAIEPDTAKTDDWLDTEAAPSLLKSLGADVISPTLVRFDAALSNLDAAVSGWDGTTSAQGDAVDLAFAEAMLVWEELELMQVGPAASSLTSPIGEDLRDEVYSWPSVNPCRVDQVSVEGGWESASFFENNLVDAYGLDALEYMLYAGADNACPNQIDINADGSWDALGADGVAVRRAGLARAIVARVQTTNGALIQAWDPAGDDLGGQLALGTDGPLGSEAAGINAVYRGLFYLESVTKDEKLAHPLGLVDCAAETCAEDVELPFSQLSTAAVAANLRGFRLVFTGGEGVGLDDLLDELGHGDLSVSLLEDVDHAIVLADALSMPIDAALVDDLDALVALHEAVREITDALKGDLATVLSLDIPDEAAGDND